MGKVLVTGGCGYIGSHTVVDLIENGFEVISIDNLSNSTASVMDGVEAITGKKVTNYEVDLVDLDATKAVFAAHPDLTGIIHFAALKSVGESVDKPIQYYENNLMGLLNVLKCMEMYKVGCLIFSSSCSVYGNTKELPVTETTPMGTAESPYARTKQIGEFMIEDVARKNKDLQYISLRYFNPAGAHDSNRIGESPTSNASNLVPVITRTALSKKGEVVVFGDDYDTRDGSCVRDYIHIMDLANAHTKALEYLLGGKKEQNYDVFNLGLGEGATVLEVIHAFEKVTGESLNYRIGPRRPGDVEAIYSNHEKATQLLHWEPKRNVEDIMRTAWAWEKVR